MKKAYLLFAILLVSTSIFAQFSRNSNSNAVDKATVGYSNSIGYSNPAKSVSLLDNGPLITDPGAGPAGADMSLTQAPNTNYGFSHAKATLMRVADDINILATNWAIDSIVFFGYQTGSTTATSTFTAYTVRIWNGVPGAPGSTVVWGDTTTNILTSSTWSGIYRGSDLTGTTRPIMRNVCTTPSLTLNGGVYWIDWQAAGSLTSGPWVPAISIVGQPITGNAMQSNDNVWANLLDGANPQGLPFIIYGTETGAYTNDVGVTSITAPVQGGSLTATTQVKVKVKNFLSASQQNIPVTCKINAEVLTGIVAGPIASGEEVEYTFTSTANMAAFGDYNFTAFTSLSGDQNLINDTVKKTITNLPAASINWNFNQGIPTNFTLINDGNTPNTNVAAFANAWIATTDDDAVLTEDSCAGSTSWFTAVAPADRWMITNSVTLTTSNILQWDAKSQDGAYLESYTVKLSTTGFAKADFTNTLFTTDGEEGTWKNRTASLSAFNGQTVYIAFVQQSTDMFVLKVDNIKILGDATVGVNSIDQSNFRVYPNPAKNELNINTTSSMKNVKIINSLGQTVLNNSVSGTNYKVNTSSFKDGIYFVQIETTNGMITKKFIISE